MTTEQVVQPTAEAPRSWGPIANLIFVLLAYAAYGYSVQKVIAAIILCISPAIDAVLWSQKRDSRLSGKLAWCEYAKILFLTVYVCESHGLSPEASRAMSYAALLFALLLVVLMLWITIEMIRAARDGGAGERSIGPVLEELLNDKTLALIGAVIAFLHITYALAFAFALSDHRDQSDLWAVQYGPPAVEQGDPQPLPLKVYKFFFDQPMTVMPCTMVFLAAAEKDEQLRKPILGTETDALVPLFAGVRGPDCSDAAPKAAERRAAAQPPADPRRAGAWNVRELYETREMFRKLEDEGRYFLVEIRGHANDQAVKSAAFGYGSNYEISRQRADQVQRLLEQQFRLARKDGKLPSVRWLAYGVSTENAFLEANDSAWLPPRLDRKLSVEMTIQEVAPSSDDRLLGATKVERRPLELTDYLYFTVYTITTTGYGDIIPISNYAKLIVTLANLIELLFFVVMVNIIANTHPEGAK